MITRDPATMHGADRCIVRFEEFIPEENLQDIAVAYRLAKDIHRGKYRNDDVTRYFEHCRHLADFISAELGIKNNWEMQVVPWLHDLVEDHPDKVDLDIIEYMFGAVVRRWVYLLTKGYEYEVDKVSYIANLRDAKEIEPLILKLGDRVVNLRTLGLKEDKEFQIRQINETIESYLPLADLLIDLIPKSDKWKDRAYIGAHIKAALENQILSFRAEFGDRIIPIAA